MVIDDCFVWPLVLPEEHQSPGGHLLLGVIVLLLIIDRFCPGPSQRSIRPQVVTTFELPGCHDMWTVISNEMKENGKKKDKPPATEEEGETPEEVEEKPEPAPVEGDKKKHGFLILSREDSTMVHPHLPPHLYTVHTAPETHSALHSSLKGSFFLPYGAPACLD